MYMKREVNGIAGHLHIKIKEDFSLFPDESRHFMATLWLHSEQQSMLFKSAFMVHSLAR